MRGVTSWHQLPLESTLALPLLLPQLKWLVSKTVFPARLSLRLSFCHSSDMNLFKSDLLLALDRNFRHWCILWSALMFLNLWLVSEPSFSVAVNIKDHVNTLAVCSFMQNHFHQAIGHFSKGLLVALYLVNHCHSVENLFLAMIRIWAKCPIHFNYCFLPWTFNFLERSPNVLSLRFVILSWNFTFGGSDSSLSVHNEL